MHTSRARSAAAAALLAASPWVVAQVSSIAAGAPRGSVQYVYDRAGNLTQVIDTSSDVDHCGQLGARCPAISAGGDRVCVNGACGAMVGGWFYDVWTDPTHCGGELVSCANPDGGSATCVDGRCGVDCWWGRMASGLACLDLLSDVHNCGYIGNACDPTEICLEGQCSVPGIPEVSAVNGTALPGVARGSPLFTGITLEGIHLDAVTRVELEDWGPDSVGTDVAAPAYVATLFGPEVAYLSTPSSLMIPAAALQAFDPLQWRPGFQVREWYKVRLHYFDGIVYGDLLVDLPVSLDEQAPVDRPAPTVTSTALVELLDVRNVWGYDGATGFIRLRDPEECGSDPRLRPPVAVLAAGDPLHREYPVHAVTRDGIYIRAGLRESVLGRFRWGPGDATPDYTATLVYAPSGSTGAFVNLSSLPRGDSPTPDKPRPPRCFTEESIPQIGGFILRGTDHYGDCSLTALDSEGKPLPATFGRPVFLGDRTVVRPELYGPNLSEPALISGIDRTDATVALSCPRGASAARLSWLGAPMIDAVEPPFVMYDHVIRLTGKFFADIQGVTFTWRDVVEGLKPTTDALLRPGQYRVVDENHIELALSARGGPVPRLLAARCESGVPIADVYPGVRGLTITNLAGSGSVAIPALDPSGPPEPSPTVECPPPPPSGGTPPKPSPSETPSVGPGLHPAPASGDSTNRL